MILKLSQTDGNQGGCQLCKLRAPSEWLQLGKARRVLCKEGAPPAVQLTEEGLRWCFMRGGGVPWKLVFLRFSFNVVQVHALNMHMEISCIDFFSRKVLYIFSRHLKCDDSLAFMCTQTPSTHPHFYLCRDLGDNLGDKSLWKDSSS